MSESFTLSSTFTVRDELSAKMEAFARLAMEVGKAFSTVNRQIKKLGEGYSAFAKMSESMEAASRNVTSFGEAASRAGREAADNLRLAAEQIERIKAAARGGLGGGGRGTGGAGGGGAGGGGGGRGHAFDYGMGAMMAGGMLSRTGDRTLGFLSESFRANAELQHQQQSLLAAGVSRPDMNAMTAKAEDVASSVRGTTSAENLKILNELRSVVGNPEEAMKALRGAAQYNVVAKNQTGNSADIQTAAKAAEQMGFTINRLTGQLNPAGLQHFFNLLGKAELSTGGRVNEKQMLNFSTTGGLAAKNLSDQGFQNLIPIINEMGGFRAGTALQAVFRQFVGGIMPQRMVPDLEKYGLLNPKMVTPTRTGVRVAAGGVKDEDQLTTDPIGWFAKVMKPALDRAGLSRSQEQTEMYRLMSTNTAMRLAGIGTSQIAMIIKDVMNQTQAQDPADAYKTLQNDPVQAMSNLAAAWSGFQQAFGASPMVVWGLNTVTDALLWLTRVVQNNSGMARTLFVVAGAFGAITAAAGAMLTGLAPLIMLFGPSAVFGTVRKGVKGVGRMFRFGGGAAAGAEAAGGEEAGALAMGLLPLGGLIIGGVIAALGAAWLVYKNWGPIKAFGTKIVDMIVSSLSAGLDMLRKELASLGLLPGTTAIPGGVPGKGLHAPPPSAPPTHGRDTGHKDSHGHEVYQQAMNVNVYLDGQQIAATVTKHQVNALRGPNRGPGRFDDRQSPRNASDAVSFG